MSFFLFMQAHREGFNRCDSVWGGRRLRFAHFPERPLSREQCVASEHQLLSVARYHGCRACSFHVAWNSKRLHVGASYMYNNYNCANYIHVALFSFF